MKISMVAGWLLSAVVCLPVIALGGEGIKTPQTLPTAKPSELTAKPSDPPVKPAESGEYLLRYKFHKGDVVRWTVVHRCLIRTTVTGSTQTADTATTSVKVWQVQEVKADGSVVFDHIVESVDMRHSLSGRDAVHYNSHTDACAPHGFEDVARAVGMPLSRVTIDKRGKVLERKQNAVKSAVAGQGEITVQLPEKAVSVGSRWSCRNNLDVPFSDGSVKHLRALQSYTLESVKTGVATISTSTQILTPIQDPAVEAQVLQYETSGSLRFDIEAGQILGQQIDVDKSVVGFRGEASSIHYTGRSTEEYLAPAAKVAAAGAKR